MNVRSLSNLNQILAPEKVHEMNNRVKSHDATERDADGRESQSQKPRLVTEEELEKIIKSLKDHPGVKANNLTIELAQENLIQVIFIKAADGSIVRRVTEDQFFHLLESLGQTNGRIFNRAA